MHDQSQVRLVVTDVDGTLVVPHSHTVSVANLATLEELEMSGCHVAIATARPPQYVKVVVSNMSMRGLHVVDGGSSIYDFNSDQYVWKEWLSVEKLQEVTEVVMPYARNVIDCFPEFNIVPVGEFTSAQIVDDAPYVYTQIDPGQWGKLSARLASIAAVHYSVVGRGADVWHVQVCSSQGSKRHGVEQLQTMLGISSSQTLALGDDQNDEPLFAVAKTRIAMGNATPELKDLASYITDTVENDGWTQAIRKFVL